MTTTKAPPRIDIDTEFHSSENKDISVVCISLKARGGKKPVTFWTYNSPEGQQAAARYINNLIEQGAVFFAYLASAECRALESIGVDTMRARWIDLYAEWRQLKMNNNKRSYGRYTRRNVSSVAGKMKYGKYGYSVPPSFNKSDNLDKDNTEVANSYVAACYNLLGVELDSDHKDEMRDLILSKPEKFTEKEKNDICLYCESDIKHLPALWDIISKEIRQNFRQTNKQYQEAALERGRFCGPSMARIEREGIPFDTESALNLSRNVTAARNSLLQTYCDNVEHSFFVREKKNRLNFAGKWTEKYKLFERYMESKPEYKDWPRTESGRFSTDDDELSQAKGDNNIELYRQVRKAIRGLQSFDPSSKSAKENGMIFESVSDWDSRLRVLFGVIGTQTGRNAPKARRFPFAMGVWARSLIKAPPGWSVGAIDYSSQEFLVAAVLSGDPNMLEAYNSLDPYMWFCIKAGGAPEGATKTSHPEERDLFKATTLGLQFGMGRVKLARKLTIDCGREVTVKEASKLIELHRRIYSTYWKWAEKVTRTYKRDGYLTLADGFGLNSNCATETSVRNFPVQGTAAVILRRAVIRAIEYGVPVISPLHDALYMCCPDEDYDRNMELMSKAMQEAVQDTLGKHVVIRQDVERHEHGHVWVEPRAKKVHSALAPFMTPHETPINRRTKAVYRLMEEK